MPDSLAIFATTAVAIIIEAAPFLLLGSLLGAIIEVMVSEETLAKFVPRNAFGQVGVGLFAGMLLPTCECGIVPVARRLLHKGVPPRAALPYMMAAPVVNPVVIASTLYAFQGDIMAAAVSKANHISAPAPLLFLPCCALRRASERVTPLARLSPPGSRVPCERLPCAPNRSWISRAGLPG